MLGLPILTFVLSIVTDRLTIGLPHSHISLKVLEKNGLCVFRLGDE